MVGRYNCSCPFTNLLVQNGTMQVAYMLINHKKLFFLLSEFCFWYSYAREVWTIAENTIFHYFLVLIVRIFCYFCLLSFHVYIHLPFCNSDPFLSQKESSCGRGMQKVQSCSWLYCVDSFHYQCLDEITGPRGVDFIKGFMKEANVLGRAFIYV